MSESELQALQRRLSDALPMHAAKSSRATRNVFLAIGGLREGN